MDIGIHRPSPERRTSDGKVSLAASNTVYTYHCLCTHLLLATTTPLHSLPTRKQCIDKAHIMPLPPPPTSMPKKAGQQQAPMDHYGMLSTTLDRNAEVIRSDDGFERRYLQRCGRCNLVVGYQLDWSQYEGGEGANAQVDRTGRRVDLVYLLPGGFITTTDMIVGKMPKDNGALSVATVTEVKV